MKYGKRFFALLTLLVLLCCLALSAAAAPARLADNAQLLTAAEQSDILTRLDALSGKYNLDIVIATTNDSRNMELGYYAADLIDYNDFKSDNIILVVAMDQRKYVCVTTGYGIYAFSDYMLDVIYDEMESDMHAGEYAAAFGTFLELCDRALTQAKDGAPYDTDNPIHVTPLGERILFALGFSFLPGFLIGWLIARAQKNKMKTSRAQRSAESYLTHTDMTRERDLYLFTTTTRRKIEQPQGNGHGGGSSTFTGSSGTSHGGGGGGRGF